MRFYRVSSPREVQDIIRQNFSSLEGEVVALAEAGGRVCAEDIRAAEDVPGFDRSTVDGYAVRSCDVFGAGESLPAMLTLSGEVRMGEEAPALLPQHCVYVPTGGMLPQGTDAVVMVEDTEVVRDLVNCYRQVAPGENVIRRGEDIACGDVVMKRGCRIRAPQIGLLASLGLTGVRVTRAPRVGILSTGDEIVPYSTKTLSPGQVRDSNAPAICEIARQKGAVVIYGGIIRDSFEVFCTEAENLLERVDFLVLSGGSSAGTRDYSEQTLKKLSGGSLLVEGIAVQPGKPTVLAASRGKPVLGLPGHPVSALNIFSLFGAAVIDRLSGTEEEDYCPSVRARLSRNIPSRIGRTDFVRVKLERTAEGLTATPVFGRSGLLSTLALAHGLVEIPSGKEGLLAGQEVEVILWK